MEDRIHIEGRVIDITRVADAVAEMTACLWHSDGIVDSYLTACIEERANKDERRGLTHIIGLWLEG